MQRLHWESGTLARSGTVSSRLHYEHICWGRDGLGRCCGVVEFLVQLSGGWFVSLTLCYLSTSVSSKGEKSQHIFEILTSITKKRDGLPNYT